MSTSDKKIIINTESSFIPNVTWEDNVQQYEQNLLQTIINPSINFETNKFTHKPYVNTKGFEQDDIWFYFYFYSDDGLSHNGGLNYEYIGLSLDDNSKLTVNTSESFFRLDFYKIPTLENGNLDYYNKKLVFTKNLPIPLGEKVFYDPANDNIYIPVFMGSSFRNEENMNIYWFSDESAITESNLHGNAFYMTARFFNSINGNVHYFTRNSLSNNETPLNDVPYYKVTIDRTNNTYNVTDFNNNRYGTTVNPIDFYTTTLDSSLNPYHKSSDCMMTVNLLPEMPTTISNNNGSITVVVTNDLSLFYTYKWSGNGINGEITLSGSNRGTYVINGLQGGVKYYVTVTNDRGCTKTTAATIPLYGCNLSIKLTPKAPTNINNDNGELNVFVFNGIPTYTYNWSGNDISGVKVLASNNGYTYTITGLKGGKLYNVNVIDGNNCTISGNVTIPLFGCNLSLNLLPYAPTTFDGSDGKIIAYASNGIAPYTFSWSGSKSGSITLQNNEYDLNNLYGNTTYTFTVVDGNTCISSKSVTVPTNSCNLSISFSKIVPKNPLISDGVLTVTVNGGTEPYTYNWGSFGHFTSSSNYNTITGLTSGATYSVTVTDKNYCSVSELETMIGDAPSDNCDLSLNFTYTIPTSSGVNDGTLTVTVNGGVSPYVYNWGPFGYLSSESNISTISGLYGDQIYNVTVIDGNNCQISGAENLPNAKSIIPEIVTLSVFNIGDTSVCCGGDITSGTSPIVCGLCWSSESNYPSVNVNLSSQTILNSGSSNYLINSSMNTLGSFTNTINNLTPNTTYYIRAFAFNAYGLNYGMPKVVTTVSTNNESIVWTLLANSDGLSVFYESTVHSVFNKNGFMTTKEITAANSGSSEITSIPIDGGTINLGTTWSIHGKSNELSILRNSVVHSVFNSDGFYSTGVVSTHRLGPSVAIDPTDINYFSIESNTVNGNLSSSGVTLNLGNGWTIAGNENVLLILSGNTIHSVFDNNGFYTIKMNSAYGGNNDSTTTVEVTTLPLTQVYYDRMFYGVSTTLDPGMISEIGVCWSTTTNPTINNSRTYGKTYNGWITNLNGDTTYYVRGFVKSVTGDIYYGMNVSKKTLPYNILTNAATNINGTSVTLNGYTPIDNTDTNINIISYGFKTGVTINPTDVIVIGSNVGHASSIGSFSKNLTGLMPSSNYYYQAFINIEGLGEFVGIVREVTTLAITTFDLGNNWWLSGGTNELYVMYNTSIQSKFDSNGFYSVGSVTGYEVLNNNIGVTTSVGDDWVLSTTSNSLSILSGSNINSLFNTIGFHSTGEIKCYDLTLGSMLVEGIITSKIYKLGGKWSVIGYGNKLVIVYDTTIHSVFDSTGFRTKDDVIASIINNV